MDILRQANAIVYFRMLRSVGHFRPVTGSCNFVFQPCILAGEGLPNGLPEPVREERLGLIIREFGRELGALCHLHFQPASE